MRPVNGNAAQADLLFREYIYFDMNIVTNACLEKFRMVTLL